jgi:murein DD-endopeptidase MepM/ murein hydrolase activator NlpD
MVAIILTEVKAMRQKVRKKDKTAIALVLCFCVIALASVFTLKANINKVQAPAGEEVDASKRVEETAKTKPEESAASSQIPVVDSGQAKKSTSQSEAAYIAPAEGNILKGYSGKGLVYSKTLDQYMVHKGIDIGGRLDAQVKAVADGTVTKVFTDDTMGITIVIDHGNDISTVYSNLSTDSMVETGDTVKQGQVISGIGDTALFECSDEAHLHFEVLKNGRNINPEKLVKL